MKVRARLSIELAQCKRPEDFAWFLERGTGNLNEEEARLFWFMPDALNDPEYRALTERLKALGMRPFPQCQSKDKIKKHSGFYSISATCHYTSAECERSEYVWFEPDAYLIDASSEVAQGQFQIDLDDMRNETPIATANSFRKGGLHFFAITFGIPGVSDEGKRLLEKSGLTGFSITRPLPVTGDGVERIKCRYWHVDITAALALSPKNRWLDGSGNPYIGLWRPDAQEPFDSLLALDRASIEEAGKPDVAYRERFGPELELPHINKLVGSQRWFQFCKANKIKCHWTPLDVLA